MGNDQPLIREKDASRSAQPDVPLNRPIRAVPGGRLLLESRRKQLLDAAAVFDINGIRRLVEELRADTDKRKEINIALLQDAADAFLAEACVLFPTTAPAIPPEPCPEPLPNPFCASQIISLLGQNLEFLIERSVSHLRSMDARAAAQWAAAWADRNCARPLALRIIAENLKVSEQYLALRFRQQHNQSFNEYLTGRRMAEAARLLRQTDQKIGAVAKSVGYSNQRYFSRMFRRHYNRSPAEFRRQELADDRAVP